MRCATALSLSKGTILRFDRLSAMWKARFDELSAHIEL